jgi:DNA-binding CsgD family transcriptional regulator/GAF domain-containing protein
MRNPSPVPHDPNEIVAEITEELAATRLDTQALMTTLTRTLSRRKPGTWVANVMNRDPTTTRVILADDSNTPMADYVNRYVASLGIAGGTPNTGLGRQVIDSGQPVLFPRLSFEKFLAHITTTGQAYHADHPVPMPAEYVGVIVVPMHARGATIGTLAVIDWNANQQLDENDVKWIQSVADRAGIALDHALLNGAAADRLERLAALRNIALAIASSGDLRLTLSVMLEQLTTKLRVHAAGLLLPDENDREMVTAAHTGFHSASVPSYRFPVDAELRDPALVRRVGLIRDMDRIDHGQRRSLFAREGFQFYTAMPLISSNKHRGVLEVFHRSVLQPDQEWLGFFEAVGSNAAIAIEHSSMREALARSEYTPARHPGPAPDLSRLERWILALVVDGATNQDIAEKVHLSQNTVKFHVRRILQKAGAINRTELARKATQQGWL